MSHDEPTLPAVATFMVLISGRPTGNHTSGDVPPNPSDVIGRTATGGAGP